MVSIRQCIVSAAKPRSSLPPVLFGLGVEVDKEFGSRWIIEELYRLGFSVFYDEVKRFKQSVVLDEKVDDFITTSFPGQFTQWVGDNVDHNVASLDGRNSFHGMGLIAISMPCGLERRQTTKTILRLKKVKLSELVAGRGIPIRSYVLLLQDPLTQLKFKPVMQLIRPCIIQKSISLSLIWHTMGMSHSLLERRPNWSGFMQSVSEGTHPLPSETLFLPIIDLKSTDERCIYSTLTFIQEQASRLNLVTPCITFDQPRWIKAVKIIMLKNLYIVCHLGGFHMLPYELPLQHWEFNGWLWNS